MVFALIQLPLALLPQRDFVSGLASGAVKG